MEIETELKKIELEDLKFDREKFILLSREEQLDFIKRKIDFLIERFKNN